MTNDCCDAAMSISPTRCRYSLSVSAVLHENAESSKSECVDYEKKTWPEIWYFTLISTAYKPTSHVLRESAHCQEGVVILPTLETCSIEDPQLERHQFCAHDPH